MVIPKLPKPVPAIPSKARLAANLVKYRRALGLTQEDLSYRSGLHRTAVGHMEKAHRNVTFETLDALAGALNVSPDSLLASDIDTLPLEVQKTDER